MQVQALAATTIKRFGALHVLFNNAGVAVEGTEASLRGMKTGLRRASP